MRTVFWSTLLSTRSSEPSTSRPPELAEASPPTLVEATLLPLIVVPVIVALAPGTVRDPDPAADRRLHFERERVRDRGRGVTAVAADNAVLDRQRAVVVDPAALCEPAVRGADGRAIAGHEAAAQRRHAHAAVPDPPPRASVASPPLVDVEPATLPSMRVCVTVSVPQFAIPPPLANEHGMSSAGPERHTADRLRRARRDPVAADDAVRDRHRRAGRCCPQLPGSTRHRQRRRNRAPNCDSGFESLKPPVIVTGRSRRSGWRCRRRS